MFALGLLDPEMSCSYFWPKHLIFETPMKFINSLHLQHKSPQYNLHFVLAWHLDKTCMHCL